MVSLQPGTLFGNRYEIIRLIGAGAMGAVYLVCDPDCREFRAALKVLYPGVVKNAAARERFRNEIVASYRVSHRNVVRAFEYFDRADFQAYAMEYINGGDLASRMEKMQEGEGFPVNDAVNVLLQISSGLEAIHSAGIVHRDLKPENFLITSTGIIKISDFGVARLRGQVSLTASGAMVGTPKYVSPEYVETGESDHRGDIYAVGVLGFELLSGASPFRSDSRVSMMMERFEFEPRTLSHLSGSCPEELISIVSKAMAVDVQDRYQSAAELRKDLEYFQDQRGPGRRSLPRNKDAGESEEKPADETGQGRDSEIFESRILSGINQENLTVLTVPGRLREHRAVIVLTLVLALVIGISAFLKKSSVNGRSFHTTAPSLAALRQGAYLGKIRGLFDSRKSDEFALWKTGQGAFILLGRPGCRAVRIDESNSFSCGDLSFDFRVSEIKGGRASGTARETGWGTNAQWSMELDAAH